MDETTTPQLTQVECCLECESRWLDTTERWRAYIGPDGALLVYCPVCASREFDP